MPSWEYEVGILTWRSGVLNYTYFDGWCICCKLLIEMPSWLSPVSGLACISPSWPSMPKWRSAPKCYHVAIEAGSASCWWLMAFWFSKNSALFPLSVCPNWLYYYWLTSSFSFAFRISEHSEAPPSYLGPWFSWLSIWNSAMAIRFSSSLGSFGACSGDGIMFRLYKPSLFSLISRIASSRWGCSNSL